MAGVVEVPVVVQDAMVEVLPAGDYEWAHLGGAGNIPIQELDARTGQPDRSRPVIVYCHGWY